MPLSADAIISKTLKHEGVLSNHPSDRGGLTKYGITFNTFRSFIPGATEKDLRNLTLSQAMEFYKKHYFYAMGVDKYQRKYKILYLT